jgi:hypothetical protein
MQTTCALLVDDDKDYFILMRALLSESKVSRFQLDWASSYDQALKMIAQANHQVYLVDFYIDDHNGIELIKEAVSTGCNAPIILLTGQGDMEIELAAMQAGAADYLNKNLINQELLERSIRYAIERNQTTEKLKEYKLAVEGSRDLIAVVDRDYKYKMVNWSFLGQRKMNREDVIERSVADVLGHDVFETAIKPNLEKCFAGETVKYEMKYTYPNIGNREVEVEYYPLKRENGIVYRAVAVIRDITARKAAEREREDLIAELNEALAKVKTLSGFLPICSSCKKIRDDSGYWNQIETYINEHSEAQFSHGLCPECTKTLYPKLFKAK